MQTPEYSQLPKEASSRQASLDINAYEILLKNAIRGSKWILYFSASALVAGFTTNVVLATMGPETLGFYGLLILIVSVINTLFVLGGSNILVNYLPRIDPSLKGAFFFTCSTIVIAFGCILLMLCLLFPFLLDMIFGRQLDVPVALYMAIMLPILLMQALVWALLQGELKFKILAVSQSCVSWFYCILTGMMVAGGALRSGSISEGRTALLVSVLAANCISTFLGLYYLLTRYARPTASYFRWYLPKGFWQYTLPLYGGALLNFLIVNAAPVFIIKHLGLRDLGYFRAVWVLAQFVGWVPMVLDRTFYPTLCKLVSTKQPLTLVFERFSRLYMVSSSLVALIILLFSRELLSAFGKSFSDSSNTLLLMLCSASLIATPLVYLNYALVTAFQKTPQVMGSYAIAAGSTLLIYGTLVPRFGLMGVAAGFFLQQLLMLLISVLLASRLTSVSFPGRAYSVTLLALATGLVGSIIWPVATITQIAYKIAIFLFFLWLLFALRLLTRKDFFELVEALLPAGSQRKVS